MSKLDPEHLYEDPLQVDVVGQAIVILGPDAVAISMTPEAAEASITRLQEALAAVRRDAPRAPELPIDQ